jgi:leucine dehydrogenase
MMAACEHVITLPEHAGGAGDVSAATALGVVQAIRASADRVWGTPDLNRRTIAVQGLGAVGAKVVAHLVALEARPVVTDINPEPVDAAIREHGVDAVGPDETLGLDVDILSPNAIGSVINDASIPAIRAKVVADGANNVLAEERHGEELERRGITYAVDFVANSGGIVYDADRLRAGGLDHARATASVRRTAVAKLHDKRDDILVGDHGSTLIAWNRGVPLGASVGDVFKCKRY